MRRFAPLPIIDRALRAQGGSVNGHWGRALGRFSYDVRTRNIGSANYESKAKTNVGVMGGRGGISAVLGKAKVRAGTERMGGS